MLDAIARDWADTTILETPTSFANTARLSLGEAMGDADTQHAFRRRELTARTENWRLREVTLLPALALVFKDGAVVEQTRYCVQPGEEAQAHRWLAAPHRQINGTRAFVGFNRSCINHYHVITQIVPALAAYQTDPDFAAAVLLLRAAGPVLRRAMALAGIGGCRMIDVETDPTGASSSPIGIDCADLTFSSLLTGTDGPSPFCRAVFDSMIARARPPAAPTPRMIYVWRIDSPGRVMRNEAELVSMLFRHGVEPVVTSLLSLDEQIALFANARLVVGPHGAGLANIAFASAGSVLYELLPDHYVNPCMNQIAQLRGVHYWADVHKAEARPGLWRHQTPWSVDIDAVERRLLDIFAAHELS